MSKVKNIEALLDTIQEHAAWYSYDYGDKNFEVIIKISVKKGYAKATVQEKGGEQ